MSQITPTTTLVVARAETGITQGFAGRGSKAAVAIGRRSIASGPEARRHDSHPRCDSVGHTVPERRILLVDDEDDVRLPLRRFFEKSGFQVAEAASLADAEQVFRSARP